jgi:hypothetical protein
MTTQQRDGSYARAAAAYAALGARRVGRADPPAQAPFKSFEVGPHDRTGPGLEIYTMLGWDGAAFVCGIGTRYGNADPERRGSAWCYQALGACATGHLPLAAEDIFTCQAELVQHLNTFVPPAARLKFTIPKRGAERAAACAPPAQRARAPRPAAPTGAPPARRQRPRPRRHAHARPHSPPRSRAHAPPPRSTPSASWRSRSCTRTLRRRRPFAPPLIPHINKK